jgi:hypothetical protein
MSGIKYIPVSGSTTQLDVLFGTYATYYNSSSAVNWNNTNFVSGSKWRIAKYSSIGGAELTPATEFASGTISGYSQWASYTPTITGFGTVTKYGGAAGGVTAFYRREGDSMKIRLGFRMGTSTAITPTITLPGSYTIDSSKCIFSGSTTAVNSESVGRYVDGNAGVASRQAQVLIAPATSTSLLYLGNVDITASQHLSAVSSASGAFGTTTIDVYIECLIPIVGWS